jgi:hypothetical protein
MRTFTNLLIALILSITLHGSAGATAIPPATDEPKPDCDHALGNDVKHSMPTRVFVFLGESNMQGFGQRDQLTDMSVPTNVAIWRDQHNRWEGEKIGQCFGPELAFLRAWAADHPTESIGVIKYAFGGTSLADWAPVWDQAHATHPEDGPLFAQLVERWQSSGSLPVVGTFWAQMGADARDPVLASLFDGHFTDIVTQWNLTTNPAPFVYAKTLAPGSPYLDVIVNVELAHDQPENQTCVTDTDGLWLYRDDRHYNTASQLLFGTRLYARWTMCHP